MADTAGPPPSLYDEDFYSWALAQADAARRRAAAELDWANVAEELRLLGVSETRELTARYRILLLHLLKWLYQPERRSRSWRNSIAEQRIQLALHLDRNPGLRAKEPGEFANAYRLVRLAASSETDLPLEQFPELAPLTLEQAKDEAWWP